MEYIIGIAASLFAQVVKKYAGSGTVVSYLIVLTTSLLCGALYVLYAETELFATFLKVLTVAGAFHNFIIRRFE
jgi:hypothetical protein